MQPLGHALLVVATLLFTSPSLFAEDIRREVVQVRMPNEDISLGWLEEAGGMTLRLSAESAAIKGERFYIGDGEVALELKVKGKNGNDGIEFQGSIKLLQGFQFKKGSVVRVLPGFKKAVNLAASDIYVTLPGVTFELPSEK